MTYLRCGGFFWSDMFYPEHAEMVQCKQCKNWLECYELGDYFCRKCRPLKQEMKKVDLFFEKIRDKVLKELEQ